MISINLIALPFLHRPPLDPNVFYMSPTPQSPSIKSQDSPSFPYPTPPASLEGHPTLQSPLFSFGGSTPTSLGPGTTFYGFDPLVCSGGTEGTTINMMEIQDGGGNPSGGDVDCKIFPAPLASVDEIVLSLGKAIKRDVNSLISIAKNFSESEPIPAGGEGVIKLESSTAGNFPFSDTLQLLTPSSSPSMQTSSGSPPMEDSAVNELKVNEASQMEAQPASSSLSLCNGFDAFLDPNR